MDDLDRLHERLVANVRDGFPHLIDRTFRLGDIAEHLVPYRTNRPGLRFDSARQYELALMRLASGERGYLRVEPNVADAFRRALASPEPDAALLRDHSLATVALTDRGAPSAGAAAPVAATSEIAQPAAPSWMEEEAPPLDTTWPPPAAKADAPPPPPPPPPAPPSVAAAPAIESHPGPTAMGGPCRYCGHPLPEGRAVTYCPHCGQNVTVRHCPACSTELEIGWRFCITCGRAMDDAALRADTR